MSSPSLTERGKLEFTILRIQRKIKEGEVNPDKILKYLRFLSHAPINLDMLRATSIGKTVNTLRKEDGKIGDKAKSLIIKWKDIASNHKHSEKNEINHTKHIIETSINKQIIPTLQIKKEKRSPLKYSHIPHKDIQNMIPSVTNSTDHQEILHEKQRRINSEDEEDVPMMNGDTKASFADMLNMPMEAMQKTKKSKKKQRQLLQNSKINRPGLPELPSTLNIDADISDDMEVNSSGLMNSHHVPKSSNTKRSAGTIDDNQYLQDIVSRRTKSHMYAGKKNTSGVVTSLYQQAMRVLIENVESLYDTGGVPFTILKPLLSKCSPYQLQRLEQYNPHFMLDEESDEIWKAHCQREFKGRKPDEMEQWRELYQRLCDEREVRLRKLSSKITAHQAAKVPERSVKLAYVAARPNVHAKKNKTNSAFDSITKKRLELKEKLEKEHPSDAVAVPFTKVPKRDRCSFRPPSSLSHGGSMDFKEPRKKKDPLGTKGPSQLMPTVPKKPVKKPMMAAAMKLMKKQHGRMTSQIVRR